MSRRPQADEGRFASRCPVKVYLVGGAVRDRLLDLPFAECDWVVVGADPAAMLAEGFVAADAVFPVFLHPDTGEEYALARRETKQGQGYRGFEVEAGADVSLEEDLRRRDLTINAMAEDGQGHLIDPYGGREDLDQGLLRHVTPAFVEDPVRVLRIARFAAKLGHLGFRIAHGTHRLMQRMAEDGTLEHLKAERVWREMKSAMAMQQPWRFFEVLHRCGALGILIPELAESMGQPGAHEDATDPPPIARLKRLCGMTADPSLRLVVVLLDCVADQAAAQPFATRLRADRETAQLLLQGIGIREQCRACAAGEADQGALLEVAARLLGQPVARGEPLSRLCAAIAGDIRVGDRLLLALEAGRGVSPATLAARGLVGAALGEALAGERRRAMHAVLQGGDPAA